MKTTIMAGVGLMLAGLTYKLYQNFKQQQNWKPPQRDVVLKMMIDMREKLYLSMLKISQNIQYQLKNSMGLNMTAQKMKELQRLIISDECDIGVEIKSIMKQIYKQISEQDFNRAIDEAYINDSQIQFHKNAFQQQFKKCFLGVQPPLKTQMPTYMTPQRIITLVKKLLSEKIERIKQFQSQSGTITQDFLVKDSQIDSKIRIQQLKKIGLKQIARPSQIFQFCVSKYLNMSEQFRLQYNRIVQQYRQQLAKYNK